MSHKAELNRVSAQISGAILDFCQMYNTFCADDVRRYVRMKCGPRAPGSADRILRHLRAAGKLDYVVVNRKASLYRVTKAPKPAEAA